MSNYPDGDRLAAWEAEQAAAAVQERHRCDILEALDRLRDAIRPLRAELRDAEDTFYNADLTDADIGLAGYGLERVNEIIDALFSKEDADNTALAARALAKLAGVA